jgi:large subunit ribosomal protein L6
MSRIGRKPVPVPKGVEVSVGDGVLHAKGPLGVLDVVMPQGVSVRVGDGNVEVGRHSDSKLYRSLHGLTRTLVQSALLGVSKGYERKLEVIGVGWRAEVKGKKLILHLGYTHPITIEPRPGIEFATPDPTHIVVKGRDKQAVGQTAAEIRSQRPPEPYKGKGVRYDGEHVRRKAGKTAAG